MGRNRFVVVGAALLFGGCAGPTRAPASALLPESASAPATIAAEPAATEAAEPAVAAAAAAPAAVADAAAPASSDLAAEPAQAGATGANMGPGKGDSIVTAALQISNSRSSGDTTNSIAGSLGGGYFLEDQHEVGGQLLVNYIAPPGPNAVIFFLAPYYNYNYRLNPRLTVYGGPHFGYARFESGGTTDNSFQFGAQAGGRYWLQSNTAAYAEWRYTHYKSFGTSTNDLTLLLGLAFTF